MGRREGMRIFLCEYGITNKERLISKSLAEKHSIWGYKISFVWRFGTVANYVCLKLKK